nr:hypothetical protein [Coxiella-like endosymbiont]
MGTTQDNLTETFDDLNSVISSVISLFETFPHEIAAVIVETRLQVI